MHVTTQPGGPGVRRRAFSLIEVLIALAVLVIGMVGVLAGFAAAVDLHKRGMDQTSAALLAESELGAKEKEALAGETCSDMSTGGFEPSPLYPAYERRVTCTPLNSRECRMVVEVRVRAQSKQDAENIVFETVLLRR